MANALGNGRWSAASDFQRLSALWEYGGVYLDTDMEIVGDLEGFLDNRMFLGWMNEKYLNGAIIGAVPRHPIVKTLLQRLLTRYDGCQYPALGGPGLITEFFKERFKPNPGAHKKHAEFTLYPQQVFYPTSRTAETAAIHHWTGLWDEKAKPDGQTGGVAISGEGPGRVLLEVQADAGDHASLPERSDH